MPNRVVAKRFALFRRLTAPLITGGSRSSYTARSSSVNRPSARVLILLCCISCVRGLGHAWDMGPAGSPAAGGGVRRVSPHDAFGSPARGL